MVIGNRKRHFIRSFMIFLTACCCQFALAETLESAEHLTDITKNFLLSNIHADQDETVVVNVSPTVSQLQLATCTREIEPSFPMNINKDQASGIELSCNGAKSWHVLIPVEIKINTKVIVAKQTIMPKEAISEDDIEYAEYDKNHLYNSYFKNKEEVLGQVAAHLITPGMVLTKKNLQQPVLVHRNDLISLIVRKNAISVTMQGIAKSDGSINTMIKAYNPTSKKTLDAMVVGPNRAEIVA